ncbi:hypothetical protein E1A91_D11G344100v1 [Gossypium mustelinum]|uniref:Uncharacterized protein n=3 Tax=Gossypium TaxID=3633 RepID=A0A5J5PM59_GOSBA|nr:hypothetical protein ES319_D11G335400v1 [Gossypium barbadense]TYG47632.1 hypothetical protein ES288_D11G355300v1 [Gossypium darwinii]TYI58271.1 hypothetical protein E1A91_D11G344100v1 [Gossypium mustelinum]
MDRPPSTCGLPIIFMLDHLLLEDDEVSPKKQENHLKTEKKVLKRLMNSRLAQHGRLGPMYLNIERQVSFWMFPSGARFNVLGFSSENGLNNVAMMGYAFDPNKNYVFVIGKLSGVNFVVSSLKILQMMKVLGCVLKPLQKGFVKCLNGIRISNLFTLFAQQLTFFSFDYPN